MGLSRALLLFFLLCATCSIAVLGDDLVSSLDSDIDPEKSCKSDIATHCADVEAGEMRLYDCLKAVRAKQTVKAKEAPLKVECKNDLQDFRIKIAKESWRNTHLNKACQNDMAQYCPSVQKVEGKMLECLRKVPSKLSANCKAEVLQEEMEGAQNVNFDAALADTCVIDIQTHCSDKVAGEGEIVACLKKQWRTLAPDCSELVFERLVEQSEDIRLNYPLIKACTNELGLFCADVQPGSSRLFDCLKSHRKELDFSFDCQTQVQGELQLGALDSRFDFKFRKACKSEIESLCGNENEFPENGNVLQCMFEKEDQVHTNACKNEITRLMADRLSRYDMNPMLTDSCDMSCASDECIKIKSACGDAMEGTIQQCLWDNRDLLPWDCYSAMLTVEIEKAEDVNFNPKMMQGCSGDITRFCSNIEHGEGRVINCLIDHASDNDMSADCRDVVVKNQEKKSEDIRLNPRLFKACEEDIMVLCPAAEYNLETSLVLDCLHDHAEDVKSQECNDRVHRAMALRLGNIDFNPDLKRECATEREKFCKNEKAGYVQQCLRKHMDSLGASCKEELKNAEEIAMSDYHFDPVLVKACASDIPRFCKDVPHGSGRVVDCLSDHKTSADMSSECANRIRWIDIRKGTDYRLNPRLEKYCMDDAYTLCQDKVFESEGEGELIACLKQNLNNIQSSNCHQEVFRMMEKSAEDVLTDAKLAAACKADIGTHCADVTEGDAKIRTCLRDHKDSLTDKCKTELRKSAVMASQDIRLRYQTNKACEPDEKSFCQGIEPGDARMTACLQQHMEDVTMTSACKEALMQLFQRQEEDAVLDYRLMRGCMSDLPKVCRTQMDKTSKEAGGGILLECLLKNREAVSEKCESELGRMVWIAFRHYETGAKLTQACDTDVSKHCQDVERTAYDTVKTGIVHKCLVDQQRSLTSSCKSLLSFASNNRGTVPGAAVGTGTKGSTSQVEEDDSFLVIRGPMALAALVALVGSIGGVAYYLYRQNSPAAKGYVAAPFVPKDI